MVTLWIGMRLTFFLGDLRLLTNDKFPEGRQGVYKAPGWVTPMTVPEFEGMITRVTFLPCYRSEHGRRQGEKRVWGATEFKVAEPYAWPERCGGPFLPKELHDDVIPDLGPRLWQVVVEAETPESDLRPRRFFREDQGVLHVRP